MSQLLLEISYGILLAIGSLALVMVLMEKIGLGLAMKNSGQNSSKEL